MLCRECNNQNPDELQYCRHCGAPLGETPALGESPAPTQPPGPLPRAPIAPRAGPPTALIVGLVLFSLLIVFSIFAAMLFPVFSRARATAHKAECLSNVRNLSLSLQLYFCDNDDCFLPATNWCDVLHPYVHNREVKVFACPAAPDLPCGYAFNASLSGASMLDVYDPGQTVAFFESDRGWNAAGGPELLPYEPRHLGGNNFGYVDGHAAWVSEEAISEQCIWNLQSSPDDYSKDHLK